jgi:glycosyltransferase involved in cell wall biosynthesis
VLNLAGALGQWADVTVAFRRILEPVSADGYRIIELDPEAEGVDTYVDDAATRGVSYRQFLSYLGTLRDFAKQRLGSYDVVLEKSWLLSGFMSSICARRGIPAIPIENLVPVLQKPWKDYRGLSTYAKHFTAQLMAGRFLRRAPVIIAETEYLRAAMAQRWQLDSDRIRVVSLGVDNRFFQRHDQNEMRAVLGIRPETTVLLYVGVLDRAHDIAPVLCAFKDARLPSVELHIVGDGPLADEYRALGAGNSGNVVFHGRVPYERVPGFIAAADLCLAPYSPSAFPAGEVAYSTLKIPEYMSVARPVVSVPSGRIRDLITHGVTGFLFDNEVPQWKDFLQNLPPREQLKHMGELAGSRKLNTWSDTAAAYLNICEEAVAARRA